MNLLTRITATLTATAEKTVSRVENHDAIVDAAIRDTRRAASQAKVRYSRVVKDGEALRSNVEQMREKEKLWTRRATESATVDKNKAMACLQRRNECRTQRIKLEASLAQHQTQEQTLTASIKTIENRLREITQQRNQMRSRESTVKALEVINRIDDDAGYGIDDAFDRWSMNISETELTVGSINAEDSLEVEFTSAEERAALAADLAKLIAEPGTNHE